MSKATYAGSFIIALTLIIGSVYFSQSFVMSFASTSVPITIARAVIALLMLGLMFTNPPRSVAFRAVLGAASIGFVTWAINYALSGSIAIADSILFLHAALSFSTAALEPATYKVIDVETDDSEERTVNVRTAQAHA